MNYQLAIVAMSYLGIIYLIEYLCERTVSYEFNTHHNGLLEQS